jgi:uncharacterized membrane protein
LLVSIGSYVVFPQSWIFFGVLHHIAIASLLGLAFLRFDSANLLIGGALIALGVFMKVPLFDASAMQWIGLMTHKPITEDYVPLLPWFGVVLVGMFVGHRLMPSRLESVASRPILPGERLLALMGRHSLLLYMVHQPIFLALLYLFIRAPQ